MGLSVAILARDEETTIAAAIGSVRSCADEVVVLLDPRTSDDTAELSTRAGARVEHLDEWPDMAGARNEAVRLCQNDIVLHLDGHEQLSPGGAERLTRFLADGWPEGAGPSLSLLVQTAEREGGVVAPAPRLLKRDAVEYTADVHPLPTDARHAPRGAGEPQLEVPILIPPPPLCSPPVG